MFEEQYRTIHEHNRIGLGIVALLVGGAGVWAATTDLAGAVIAPGTVVVQSQTKRVQHPSGGIVGGIYVKDGDAVDAGQLLLRFDDTLPRTTLGVVQAQLDELLARQARLMAERDNAEQIVFAEELEKRSGDSSVAGAIAGERKLFESRRLTLRGQRSQLQERSHQVKQEVTGLVAQQASKETELKLLEQELAGVQELYQKNLVSIQRFMQLRRDQARIEGQHGQIISDIARARGRISEIELQIIQTEHDFQTDVLREIRLAESKIAELRERRTAAEDQLKRIEITAPHAGIVHQLSVHTVGGVVANGDTMMLIVPRSEELVIEAKVRPEDIDQVEHGAKVAIRIRAGNQRTTPEVFGKVIYVAADLSREQQTNLAFYLVRISLAAAEVQRLGNFNLMPGMPADTYILTQERTPLQYIMRPLQEQIARAFRER